MAIGGHTVACREVWQGVGGVAGSSSVKVYMLATVKGVRERRERRQYYDNKMNQV